MILSRETLAAYADGELEGDELRRVEQAIAADPELMTQVRAHRALKQRLSSHFDQIAAQPVPPELAALIRNGAKGNVIGFAGASATRKQAPPRIWWSRPAIGLAIAASLAVVVIGLGTGRHLSGNYADGQLASALDTQLAEAQPAEGPVRILLSVRGADGQFCRGFTTPKTSGIACRDDRGWKLAKVLPSEPQSSDPAYRQAGSPAPAVLEALQNIAQGAALSATQEREARQHGWR